MNAGRWGLRRLRPPGVRAVPVWNLPLPKGELWQLLGVPRVLALRGEGCAEEAIGRDQAAVLGEALDGLRERLAFDGVFVGGGLCSLPGFGSALRVAMPVRFSTDGAFVGEAGGRALLQGRRGAVVDVGQTGIKLMAEGHRLHLERDTTALPLRFIGTPRPEVSTSVFARFLARAIGDLLRATRPPDPVMVLALPCPLEDDLVPGPCTYGWERHHDLLPEVFRMVDEDLRPWPELAPEVWVLNDAELAAVSARAAGTPGRRRLALTLGFGPGAALLDD